MNSTSVWAVIIGVLVIVIANVIATEYRLGRERTNAQNAFKENGFICPACPACPPTNA